MNEPVNSETINVFDTALKPTVEQRSEVHGMAAAFESPDALLSAAKQIRAAGYRKVEAYTPFPVHGIDEILDIPRSKLGWVTFTAGLCGMLGALFLQWWTGSVSYPLVIGGKPFFAFEPSIPITFELTVLLASFGTVFGMFHLNRLPTLYHPMFNFRNFWKVSDNQFILVIERDDPKFEAVECARFLRTLHPLAVEMVEE